MHGSTFTNIKILVFKRKTVLQAPTTSFYGTTIQIGKEILWTTVYTVHIHTALANFSIVLNMHFLIPCIFYRFTYFPQHLEVRLASERFSVSGGPGNKSIYIQFFPRRNSKFFRQILILCFFLFDWKKNYTQKFHNQLQSVAKYVDFPVKKAWRLGVTKECIGFRK
jgi:hypothetical protein